METAHPRVFIPPSADNLNMVLSVAASDQELQAAMDKDAQAGRSFGGYVSPPNRVIRTQLTTDFLRGHKISTNDTKSKAKHTHPMNDITRHELDAKLEAIEARMDGRVASIEGKIDAFLAAQAVRDQANDRRFDGIEISVQTMRSEIRGDIKSMKNTTIVTAISAVLAIVFGIVTFNATLSSNMLAAFQAGKAEAVSAPPTPAAPAVTLPPDNKTER